MHSWRVLLLPYMEESGLFNRYDFEERWNGPNNSRLKDQIPVVYRCPADATRPVLTSYVALIKRTRQGASWHLVNGRPVVVQVSGANIEWMEPKDLTVQQALAGVNMPGRACISSPFHDGAYTSLREMFLPNTVTKAQLRELLSVPADPKNAGSAPDAQRTVFGDNYISP